MAFADSYIEKYLYKDTLVKKTPLPAGSFHYIVVIPAYCEDDIYSTLQSLVDCKLPSKEIMVIIAVNYSVKDSNEIKAQNDNNYLHLTNWAEEKSTKELAFVPVLAPNLPAKHAGAGLARKIGMDLAIMHFNKTDNHEGVIVSLDADTIIPKEYFLQLENGYTDDCNIAGCIFNFSHLCKHEDQLTKEHREAIISYELHLRYFRHGLLFANYPYNLYTIGSCFSVKAKMYCKYGGMNRRKAGEDFYFLHKIFPNEKFSFLKDCQVYPSPRLSKRVPFGTGPVINKILEGEKFTTYAPNCFVVLKEFLDLIMEYYPHGKPDDILANGNINKWVVEFLGSKNFTSRIEEIKSNVSNETAFHKRFLNWFNGLLVIQLFNFLSEKEFKKLDVKNAVNEMFHLQQKSILDSIDKQLDYYEELEKS
ncbi:MAG: hypothetical protein MI922_26760 [Bacteroidales bacterium]|nr:hypothetical protein [Bacteroidales bacterium]